MNGSDRKKIIDSGITIMRAHEDLSITKLNPAGSWGLVARFTTKIALKKAVASFREDKKTIFEND
ncbi:MAG: hypothetical protein WC856_13715 [Methylococcaceae bacterium]|jgi:hypothetical protein